MKLLNLAVAAGALALGLAVPIPSRAQGPLYDRVDVNLPYTVTVGDKTLQPGEYVIQQMPSAANTQVLLIYADNGMKFETSAMTIPTLNQNTPEDTKVILHHYGPDYYFDKIWIQGKDYGYEFPLPPSVKAREKERMEPISVAATYQSTPAPTTTTTTETTTAATNKETTTAATNQQTTTPATNQQTTTAEAQQPTTTQPTTTQQPVTTAPATQQATTMAPATEATTANRTMPKTSADWLMMLLSGGSLSGLGLMLRRKRQ